MRVNTFLGAAVIAAALLACKASRSDSSISRYGDEVAVAGNAYVSDKVTARAGADESAEPVDDVPAGTQVEKVAEKDDFILVKWSDKGESKQGWVPKNKAEPTPDLAPRVERGGDEDQGADPKTVKGSRLRLPDKKVAADPPKEEKPTGWKADPPEETKIADEKPGWKADPPKEEKPTGWRADPPPKEVKPSGWKSDPPKEDPPKEVKPSGWKGDPPKDDPPKEVKEETPKKGWK